MVFLSEWLAPISCFHRLLPGSRGQPSTSTSLVERAMLSFTVRSPASRSSVLLLCFISRSKAPGRLRYVTLLSPPHLLCRTAE
ncbi:hypothetical protein YC2023_076604 [Brassica napus]|uniref:Uncharacterized protein n=1 Tax=Brassica oleracea TaxID=3712 RepID=A0A3P6GMN5_BRAOL|nr:unnamed protein product [Brassica oleracea]